MDWHKVSENTYYRGRVALHAILRAMGVGKGDEVATQAFTCVAVPEAILACGATPVYVDIESQRYNLCPKDLKEKISPKTRAVIVQHTFGIPAALSDILQVTEQAGVPVIEDCCHTFLSTHRGRRVGSFGVASFYSFEWGKPLVVGIGGSAVANDTQLTEQLVRAHQQLGIPNWRRQAKLELQRWVHHALYRPQFYWKLKSLFHRLAKLGVAEGNYNPVGANEFLPVDFLLQMAPRLHRHLAKGLSELEQRASHSRQLVAQLEVELPQGGFHRPSLPPGDEVVYARYPLRVDDKNRLLAKAREGNVELAEWYRTPIHPLGREQSGLVSYEPASCPHAESRSREVVSLPLHARVGRRYVEQVDALFRRAA